MPSSESPPRPNELFRQAVESLEAAVKSGAKIQEESVRRFTESLRDFGSPLDWQRKAQRMAAEAVHVAQKGVDEAVGAMNKNTQTAMDLATKAFSAASQLADAGPEETSRQLWEATLGAMRSNVEATLQANTRMMESWTELVRRVNGDFEEFREGVRRSAERAADQAARSVHAAGQPGPV